MEIEDISLEWTIGGFDDAVLTPVGMHKAAVSNGSQIKIIELKTSKVELLKHTNFYKNNHNNHNDNANPGIGQIAGRDDQGVLAWSEYGPRPCVRVIRFLDDNKIEVFLLEGN